MSEGLLDIIEERFPKVNSDSLKYARIFPNERKNKWILISKPFQHSTDFYPTFSPIFNPISPNSNIQKNFQIAQITQTSQLPHNCNILKQSLFISSIPVNWKVERNRDYLIKKINSASLIIRYFRGYLARRITFKLKQEKYSLILKDYIK